MAFRALQWCPQYWVGTTRTSCCARMITLFGARNWIQARAGGCEGEWVGSGQITNLIKLDLIDIIQFCLKIYDLWRHLHLWVDGWVNGFTHVKSLKSNKL